MGKQIKIAMVAGLLLVVSGCQKSETAKQTRSSNPYNDILRFLQPGLAQQADQRAATHAANMTQANIDILANIHRMALEYGPEGSEEHKSATRAIMAIVGFDPNTAQQYTRLQVDSNATQAEVTVSNKRESSSLERSPQDDSSRYGTQYRQNILTPNAYGQGVHMNQYGQPVTLRPDFGGVPGEQLQIQPNTYGPGIHSDQYGRPVREYPWP